MVGVDGGWIAARNAAPLHKLRLSGSMCAADSTSYVSFLRRGSRGNIYRIDAILSKNRITFECTCPAGINKQRCYHVSDILNGVLDGIESNNEHDILLIVDHVKLFSGNCDVFPDIKHANFDGAPKPPPQRYDKSTVLDLIASQGGKFDNQIYGKIGEDDPQ